MILNMIYERQIKRALDYLINQPSYFNLNHNLDLFVISATDPTAFLDYATISYMNNTLDCIYDPEDLEYRIYLVLDHLAFLHLGLHCVNLDIKPQNIFLGRPD
jgi:hypothetical protein